MKIGVILSYYVFQSSCGTARWAHVVQLWRLNAGGKYKTAWKLRAAHVFLSTGGKMSVKLAAQVISRSVAVGKYIGKYLEA